MKRRMSEAEQIRLTQLLLQRKRQRLARRESIGGLTEADLPWDQRTVAHWEAEKERIRRERLRAERYQ